MKLYEISDIYRNVLGAIENEECTEADMQEALGVITTEFEEKADSVACIIKDLQSNVDGIKAEQANLLARRKTAENRLEWLKSYLTNEMLATGMMRVETPRNKLSFRRSTQVQISDELTFKAHHPELCKTKITVDADKKAIGDALKKGEIIEGAALVEKQNLQIK